MSKTICQNYRNRFKNDRVMRPCSQIIIKRAHSMWMLRWVSGFLVRGANDTRRQTVEAFSRVAYRVANVDLHGGKNRHLWRKKNYIYPAKTDVLADPKNSQGYIYWEPLWIMLYGRYCQLSWQKSSLVYPMKTFQGSVHFPSRRIKPEQGIVYRSWVKYLAVHQDI